MEGTDLILCASIDPTVLMGEELLVVNLEFLDAGAGK